ncbi:uncharacterized protein LOC130613280 isoform X2 [Hydractinia symbiolongicarpus]|uniref:uncharacterized protein LOC130613280 isoform X2 n=1 Tax=Hydractinia symbiolongicarpus TaxID=13093 RepID=UPI00254BECA1|nr:uncharacterized protein LOC130613280 isoform X2 [Hydractinia symbiolongicarpus]
MCHTMPPFYFDYSDWRRRQETDPIKRFEHLRNAKPSSVMIRATPNSVRWDEINRVQYRFQALNFHSDVLEALIHNSPPLSRRERALTSPSKKVNQSSSCSNEADAESDKKDLAMHARVRCIRRSASFDASNTLKNDYLSKRKGSVVQILKDDTSDYNSDEDVFPKSESGSLEKINYNATLCHVENRHITETTQIQVTHVIPEERSNTNASFTSSPDTVDVHQPVFIPTVTHVTACCHSNVEQTNVENEDLAEKSKEELIMMVKKLQGQLSHTENETTSNTFLPTVQLQTPCSPESTEKQENDVDESPKFSVSVLINNFEKPKNVNTKSNVTQLQISPMSPSGRVRTLSANFEEEFKKTSSVPTSPVVGKRLQNRPFHNVP